MKLQGTITFVNGVLLIFHTLCAYNSSNYTVNQVCKMYPKLQKFLYYYKLSAHHVVFISQALLLLMLFSRLSTYNVPEREPNAASTHGG